MNNVVRDVQHNRTQGEHNEVHPLAVADERGNMQCAQDKNWVTGPAIR